MRSRAGRISRAFVTPGKPGRWAGQAVEALLYRLWDLGLKLGPSTRSVDELIALASTDHTVRTALLEARWLWGDEPLSDEVQARFWKEVVAGQAKSFVTEKLEERNARHRRARDHVTWPGRRHGRPGRRAPRRDHLGRRARRDRTRAAPRRPSAGHDGQLPCRSPHRIGVA
jgi:UTP:GlnB (protein PII) uridylyltransferase